ncbi:MAG TPA: hypothetical protein P5307_03055 [Pirellulaceae bacterium]|nr:hypothetical protein [Pirellulaceae bacterium]
MDNYSLGKDMRQLLDAASRIENYLLQLTESRPASSSCPACGELLTRESSKETMIERLRADALLPGEIMHRGESLVSANQRFELKFENSGSLSLWLYASQVAVPGRVGRYNVPARLWSRGNSSATELYFPQQTSQPGGLDNHPPLLRTANHQILAKLGKSQPPVYRHVEFVVQDDGNLVTYFQHPQQRLSDFATDTYQVAAHYGPKAVIPNKVTVTFQTGQLAIDTQPGNGNGDFVNETDLTIGVRDNDNYVTLPPGAGVVALGLNGQVSVAGIRQQFNADGSPFRVDTLPTTGGNSGDAEQAPIVISKDAPPNGRFRIGFKRTSSGFQLT